MAGDLGPASKVHQIISAINIARFPLAYFILQLIPSLMRACATAGASRCKRGLTASGVPSLSPKPVPPEVSIRSTFNMSHHFVMTPCIASVEVVRRERNRGRERGGELEGEMKGKGREGKGRVLRFR